MPSITCEMCGSTDIIKENGVYVCRSCGTKYTVEEARKLITAEAPAPEPPKQKCDLCDREFDGLLCVRAYFGKYTKMFDCCPECFEHLTKQAQVRVLKSDIPQYPINFVSGSVPRAEEEEEETDETEKSEDATSDESDEKACVKKWYEESAENKAETVRRGKKIFRRSMFIIGVAAVALCVILVVSGSKNKTKYPPSSYKSSPSTSSSSNRSASSSSGTKSEKSDSVYIPSELSDTLMSRMWEDAKTEVKKHLKSPSTAKFEKYYSNDVRFIKGSEEDVKTGGFNVSVFAYVDSQNAYGAEIRSYFCVFFMVESSTSYKVIDCEIIG